MNTAARPASGTHAARSEIAPVGSSRLGGARVLGVDVAIDDAVEPHRGGARARHGDDDAGDARDRQPTPRAAIAAAASANGSANNVCSNLTMRPNFTTWARRWRPSAVS